MYFSSTYVGDDSESSGYLGSASGDGSIVEPAMLTLLFKQPL